MPLFLSPLSLSIMDPPHFLGNFASPEPLNTDAVGSPKQIAYYSCFPGPTNEHEYQSRSALKLYSPPIVPFSFIKAPDRATWSNECDYLDSLSRPEVEPIIASCQRAGCTVDLQEADVIAKRGALVNLAVGKGDEYDVSFVDGKLHILRKSFEFRTEIKSSGPYYGDCFEKLCTRPMTPKPHGIFFSVVRRKIGGLNVIMAGEVDCSSSKGTEPDMEDYIELKTVKKPDQRRPPGRSNELFPKWYMQSHLLGVQVLQIGYRDFKNRVFGIVRKPIKQLLREAQKYAPSFDPAVDMGRVHAIISALLVHFRGLGPSVSAQDRFVLRVDANGDAWITSDPDSPNLAA
ncbi:hypothetical protein BJ322DRAFT_1084144 [Thelephora terrestris]|uniref:Decapping nuclease n=1 Tax=Thelephora terrestris TaxID=56493 RepID=A0A9P6L2Y4_9AGAM|nr:hypothetical protein BJ322DRAFT_1084144 [Thelephora terrestris]